MKKKECKGHVEVFSRVCGFFRPVQSWNKGKGRSGEYGERITYNLEKYAKSDDNKKMSDVRKDV